MNIIEKIKSLTPKEVIMAMVEGLQNPKTEIKMKTYGYKDRNGICYGCAATNCLLTLDPTLELGINNNGFNYLFPVKESVFIDYFESAINCLRCGEIEECNHNLSKIGISKITNKNNIYLTSLEDDYTQEDLIPYIKLAEAQ